jgi:hypothetical protein
VNLESKPRLFAGLLIVVLFVAAFVLSAGSSPDFLYVNRSRGTSGGLENPGLLVVSVIISSLQTPSLPGAFVHVGVAQAGAGGVHISLQTNASGLLQLPLPAGQYSVALSDPRFAVQPTPLPVRAGSRTSMEVSVNRTVDTALFTEFGDADGSGVVQTWETLTVGLWGGGIVSPGGAYPDLPSGQNGSLSFGSVVFVQPLTYTQQGLGGGGKETEANVLNQGARGDLLWLTLQPSEPLSIAPGLGVVVVNYSPGYRVTYSNG